ncbi:ATP-binding protein [Lentzea sp. BCCO 10_0061]|uniref:ATP-binding protein n=1 Tax=Lentzea sokolovensis TaxID=3095429 RepID=A0ABU4UQD6_9PSEU|nr:ATP-binding protein [Lentzea sp. BCCO 10_0061]MDX8141639.1 ATP-binding protein [Lentzea sp. BCCO 10_0061]
MTALAMDVPVRPGTTMSSLRRELTTALRDLDEDHLYDVQLVVTELVSNVLDHTPAGAGRLRIMRSQEPCLVTVEVDDESAVEPVYGRSRLGEYRGRGIVVVDNISREWGFRQREEGGKTVYALVDCTG